MSHGAISGLGFQPPRSVQDWLHSRRDESRVPLENLPNGHVHWGTSGRMPQPPKSAYNDPTMAAGTKHQKGFPSWMPNGQPTTGGSAGSNGRGRTIFNNGAPPSFSFSERFAAAPDSFTVPGTANNKAPYHPPPVRLNATMASLRADSNRLSAYSEARGYDPSIAGAAPPSRPPSAPLEVNKQILRPGDGATASPGDLLDIAYAGWLSGSDPSDRFDARAGFRFTLGMGEVIPGWDAGVVGMKEGEVARLRIPAHLAYGAKGSPPVIPPNADLTFDVQLVEVLQAGFASAPNAQPNAQQQPPQQQSAGHGGVAPGFASSESFAGPRAGMTYKMGAQGLGYYRDPKAPAAPADHNAGASNLSRSVKFEPGLPPPPSNPVDPRQYRDRVAAERAQAQAPAANNPLYGQYATATRFLAGQGDFTRNSFRRM
jgi:FKBP-type peptidyl-prolyl cis-trans isomerase FkpA